MGDRVDDVNPDLVHGIAQHVVAPRIEQAPARVGWLGRRGNRG